MTSLSEGNREFTPVQQDELQQNLISDIHLTEKLFQEDRIAEGYFLLQNIDEFVKHLSPALQGEIQDILDKSKMISQLREKGREILSLLELFNAKDEWRAWNNSIGPHQDVVVYTHRDEKKGQYFIKLEGNLHCSMIEATAAILEHDLYSLWAPMCKGVRSLASLSVCRRVMALDLEFVLLKRNAVCDM
jgi:hypothetical protein